jgi:hypothetical protein
VLGSVAVVGHSTHPVALFLDVIWEDKPHFYTEVRYLVVHRIPTTFFYDWVGLVMYLYIFSSSFEYIHSPRDAECLLPTPTYDT